MRPITVVGAKFNVLWEHSPRGRITQIETVTKIKSGGGIDGN